MARAAHSRRDDLTFKANLAKTRFGWLRLTPAYSVHLVRDLLDRAHDEGKVLDPFCGTGTTALVCAERGVACDTTDINPFLLWLAATKSKKYAASDVDAFAGLGEEIAKVVAKGGRAPWTPALHRIERWWAPGALAALGRAMAAIRAREDAAPAPAVDLIKVAFCRAMIAHAEVSFGHQSMSFKRSAGALATDAEIAATWTRAVEEIANAARSPIRKRPSAIPCDARDLRTALDESAYATVVTSPPYPNRMSYIRELRPYMYWLGYLADGRQAGELDWKAIGGTWGVATSNVAKWSSDAEVPFDGFSRITKRIDATSPVLARYVAKYFHDMTLHTRSLFDVVAPGGSVHYIVGNSKFYDVVLPVERIFASLFTAAGFAHARVETIRKRSSKKELFEFVVSADKPRARSR